jgi:ferredoxin
MSSSLSSIRFALESTALDSFLQFLLADGYQVIGPTVRDGVIAPAEIRSAAALPKGWTDRQGPGSYRLQPGAPDRVFGYALPAFTWKRYLNPPRATLWRAEASDGTFRVIPERPPVRKLALFGVRPCDLRAIELQDRVLASGEYVDPYYRHHRSNALLIAAQCTDPADNCFCLSVDAGPEATRGFDIALTELKAVFLLEPGSDKGADILRRFNLRRATDEEIEQGRQTLETARKRVRKRLDTAGLTERLAQTFEHPEWDRVEARCMACGNCTFSCPTCFCTTIEDHTNLSGATAERSRRWDSCFTASFSYIHGGAIRHSVRARYRQWLTHKLSAWRDQFGTLGCVGCGRCITWCPVGIDITEQAAALQPQTRAAREEQYGNA